MLKVTAFFSIFEKELSKISMPSPTLYQLEIIFTQYKNGANK